MQRQRIGLFLGLGLLLALGLGFLLGQGVFPAGPSTTPSVGAPVVAPPTIPVGHPTLLTVTSRITSSPSTPVVPASVKLFRVDDRTKILVNLGTMLDDGTNGDAVARDGIFTLQVSVTEPAPGELRLQVEATFRGGPGRISSGVTVVPIMGNTPPVANAGPDQTVFVGTTVQLNGSKSSDVDGDPLTFRWEFLSRPVGSTATLSDSTLVNPTFVVERRGTYKVQLIVNDGKGDSAPDSVTISTENSKPVADAGPDQTAFVGQTVTLDGSGSFDVDYGPLTYRWSFTSLPAGSGATLSDPTVVQPSFVVDRQGVYIAQLIVNDGTVDGKPDTVTITIINRPPVLETVGDQTVALGTTLTLQLTATDPDGDPLTFAAEPLPAHASLDAATGRFTFTPTADQVGTLTRTFTVSDGSLSDAETVAITAVGAAPELTAFESTSGRVGTTVTLTGTNLNTTTGVTFNGVAAPFTIVSSTTVTATVPRGATSGPITITTLGGSFTTLGYYVVLSSPDFALVAVPASATTLQEARVNYTLSVTGVDGFTGLVSLSVSGLPDGVIGLFTAPTLTSGQSTELTLVTSATTPVGTAIFTVTGSADLPTGAQSQSVSLTLDVLRGGRTSLAGQFLTNDGAPIPGVRLSLATVQTQTDGAGNFLFVDVPAGTQQLAIDANAARPGFPMYAVDVTLTTGVATVLPPFQITPPPPPERFTPINNATVDQIFTDPRFPGVEITLPKGATITGWDGTLKTRLAIERHTPDKLPVPAPPGPTRSL